MVEQYGDEPSWGELARIGRFILARVRGTVGRLDTASVRRGAEQWNELDRTLALQTTVLDLITEPPAPHHAAPAHKAAVDSRRRRKNLDALLAIANDYQMHPDFDPEWQQ